MQIRLDLSKTPFNLEHTLSCGQTFQWEKRGEWWTGVVGQTVLKLRQNGCTLLFESSSDELDRRFVSQYFRLDDDLCSIYSALTKDKYVRKAVEQFHGLRLLRQQPWECLISYICATYTNIPAIKQMICNISRQFGETIKFEGAVFYGFPRPQALARASLRDLRLCKLGYRAESVRDTARLVDRGDFDLEALKDLPYVDAKRMLLSLPGVGPKVADCVLLFSLDKLEAFPIDIWMKRIMLESYSEHFEPSFVDRVKRKRSLSRREYQALYAVGKQVFGEFLGYAQEYLYHYGRCHALQGEDDRLSRG